DDVIVVGIAGEHVAVSVHGDAADLYVVAEAKLGPVIRPDGQFQDPVPLADVQISGGIRRNVTEVVQVWQWQMHGRAYAGRQLVDHVAAGTHEQIACVVDGNGRRLVDVTERQDGGRSGGRRDLEHAIVPGV